MISSLMRLVTSVIVLVLIAIINSLMLAPLVSRLNEIVRPEGYIPDGIFAIVFSILAVGVVLVTLRSLERRQTPKVEESTSLRDFLPLAVGIFVLTFLMGDAILMSDAIPSVYVFPTLVCGLVLLLVGAVFPPLRRLFEEWKQTIREERYGLSRDARIRTALIEKVAEEVHGRLGSMLATVRSSFLEPIMERQPAQVRPPWKDLMKDFDSPNTILPRGTRIIDLFDQADISRKLLLLGAPGSGKTTLLLALARDLVDRARKRRREPIPVIIDLRSWGTQERDFKRWMIQQLHDKYAIRKDVAGRLLEDGDILTMLDGLDEVGFDKQATCIYAINQYQLRSVVGRLLVTCRSDEYAHCEAKLQLTPR